MATLDDSKLTVADLDSYLLEQPEADRQIPAGAVPEEWIEEKIRQLALIRTLEDSPEAKRLRESNEMRAQRVASRSKALVAALAQQLANEVSISDDEVAARVELALQNQRAEPQMNFRHIYLRLDRANALEKRRIRQRADEIATLARLPEADFAALAREHSESSAASGGGLVSNVRPSDLDEKTRIALATMAEGEVSPVIETRTGLHIFRLLRRLEPEPPSTRTIESGVRQQLRSQGAMEAREELLGQIRTQGDFDLKSPSWRLGPWTIAAEVLEVLLPPNTGALGKEQLQSHFLLASEAIQRGLETTEVTDRLSRLADRQVLKRAFEERRQLLELEIPEESLRPYFEAQPALFSQPAWEHLEIIFVPQGKDLFATQQHAEAIVAKLRAGASFAELARRESKGPAAEAGGDLGPLESEQWARLGPSIATVIPNLEVNRASDPVYCTDRVLTRDQQVLRGGFAILRVRDRAPARQRDFEEAIEDVRRAYSADQREELDEKTRSHFLDGAGFEILRIPDASELLG